MLCTGEKYVILALVGSIQGKITLIYLAVLLSILIKLKSNIATQQGEGVVWKLSLNINKIAIKSQATGHMTRETTCRNIRCSS